MRKKWLRKQSNISSTHSANQSLSRGTFGQPLLVLEDRCTPATITVTDLSDTVAPGNGVSLREAVRSIFQGSNLNADVVAVGTYGSSDKIQFAPALAGLTISVDASDSNSDFGPSAFAINNAVTISGPSTQGITISRNAGATTNLRLFNVLPTGNLTLQNVSLVGGRAQGGDGGAGGGGAAGMGGAIFNRGTLTLSAITLTDNQAVGGSGQARGVFGMVYGGGGGVGGNGVNGPNLVGGAGGGPNGGAGNSGNGSPGGFGGGGGAGGNSFGSSGAPGGFGGGGGSGSPSFGSGVSGGSGGYGGGAGGNPSGSGAPGGFGGGFSGPNDGDGGDGAAMGGAIFNAGGTVTITNVTFSGNMATSGSGGGTAAQSGSALGGAIFNLNGSITARNSTFANNTLSVGTAGQPNSVSPTGADIYSHQFTIAAVPGSATVTLLNNILASTAGPANGLANNGGTISGTSVGNVVTQTNLGSGFTQTTISNLALIPLAANGGPVQTIALPLLSSARNAGIAGPANGAPLTDARGETRPTSGTVDAGAFQFKVPQAITFTSSATTSYGAAFTLTATGGGSGNPIAFTLVSGPATLTGNVLTVTGLGTIVVAANQAGNTIYAPAPSVQQNITANKAVLTYAATPGNRTYGGANPSLSGTVSGFVNSETQATATSGTPAFATAAAAASPVGSYLITGSGLSASNYTFVQAAGNTTAFAVTRAPLAVTAADQVKFYGQLNPVLTFSATGFVNSENAATALTGVLATTAAAGSGIGNYPITIGSLSAANYTISFTAGNLPILPAPLTVAADGKTKVFGQANPALTATFGGLVNGDTPSVVTGLSLTTAATAASGVGNYTITPSGASAANYTIDHVTGTLAVTPAPLTVAADNKTKVYAQVNPALTASFAGFVNGDTSASVSGLTFTTLATTASGVGNYWIAPSGAAAANYAVSFASGTLTVTPAPLTVTADSQSKVYGRPNPPLTFNTGGLVNGDTAASALTGALATAPVGSGVGSYSIALGNLTAANYAITYTPATLTVTPAPLTVIAENKSKTYGQANPALTAGYTGLANGDTPAVVSGLMLATGATAASGIGAYSIVAAGATAANYVIAFAPGNLTVTPAPLTITANSLSKVYGQANPVLTARYAGFVNGDMPAAVSGLSLTTSATPTSGVGGYAITPANATAANYALSFATGTLTITPAPLTVRANDKNRFYGQTDPAFTVTTTGLVNGDTAAVVNGLALRTPATGGSRVGDYPIIPSDGSASNYAITYVPGTLTVTRPRTALLGDRQFATGVDAGTAPRVRAFNSDGSERLNLFAFDPAFTGGVRTATADFNGDGVADVVVGTGPGAPTRVRVLDGASGRELFSVAPFEASFIGGVYVAAGDLTGDGIPELVITPDEGGGPRVAIFNGDGFVRGNDFFGIDDPNFRGGARTALGDIDGDGAADLLVAAGFGGGPRIAAFRGFSAAAGAPNRLFGDLFVFEQGLRNGAFVTAGDLDGDGLADLIAGGGPGGGPRVSALSGASLLKNEENRIADFFAGDSSNRGGVRVAIKNLDGDDRGDLMVGAGTGAGSRVTAYSGKGVAGSSSPEVLFAIDAEAGFSGGVFVG